MKNLLLTLLAILSVINIKAQAPDMDAIEKKVDLLIQQMTLEEKASLCSGRDNWTFKPVERLGIPSIWLADGPHGLRKAPQSNVDGFGDQHPATCFPTASALSATWDRDLVYKVGKHIAIECQALNVNVLLGPGVNIKRSPLGGRNFEYFSEDPVISGALAVAFINGVQDQGVGTSLKHFVANNQETQRMVVSSEVNDRELHEVYLKSFEIVVKEAQPWTVMASYNPINGVDATANKFLLTDILKEEWGFEGIVISDWVSVYDRVEGVKAGMHVEMPGSEGVNDAKIIEAVRSGKLDEAQIDKLLKDILTVVFKAKALEKEDITYNKEEHHAFARRVAGEAITLLKNDNDILPITSDKYKNIALIGEFAIAPRYQGNGSSEIKPTMLDTAKKEILKVAGKDFKVKFAQGYKLEDDNDLSLLQEAVDLASKSDVAILHIGLPLHYESEGYDRKHIDIPPSHVKLVEEVSKVQKNIVVVLTNGSAISMPWVDKAPAILETWLGGQAGAGAIADVLFGNVNPSGKLAETFAVKMEDTPTYLDFPGIARKLNYGEGIFVGYRWYDKRRIEPLFPFGHGLSYTTFDYSNLNIDKESFTNNETVKVSCTIKNTGSSTGKEIVQLYIKDIESRLLRPVKELKDFAKVELQPGESKTVEFTIGADELMYYDDGFDSWIAESGEFEVLIGASSRDIKLKDSFKLNSQQKVKVNFDEKTTLREWFAYDETFKLAAKVVEPFFQDINQMPEGRLGIDFQVEQDWFLDMPVYKFFYASGGKVSEESIFKLVEKAQQLTITL